MNPADKDRLQKAIKEVVSRISRYKGGTFNEQDTKAALVEPLLEALGWDTRDPEQVRREFKTNPKDNPVDYALLLMRQPRLMVEAKGLGESMADHKWVGQTIGYAAVGGALWCVLTNGDEYQIYNATAPVAAAEKMLCKVRLSVDPIDDVSQALGLISRANLGENRIEVIWKTQHIDRRVRAVLEELFRVPDKRLVKLLRKSDPGLSPRDVLDSLRRLTIRIDQPPLPFPIKPSGKTQRSTALAHVKPAAKHAKVAARRRGTPTQYRVELADLIAAGMITPPLRLFRQYRKTTLEARLNKTGQVEYAGQTYPSCSAAASEARGSVTGRPMSTNGWEFWQFEDAGKTRTLEEVRSEFLKKADPGTAN